MFSRNNQKQIAREVETYAYSIFLQSAHIMIFDILLYVLPPRLKKPAISDGRTVEYIFFRHRNRINYADRVNTSVSKTKQILTSDNNKQRPSIF